jgi:hypothetical protein
MGCRRFQRGKSCPRPYSWYSKTSSRETPNTRAMRNASASEGTYFSCSSAMIVWRVHSVRTASSCWVISSFSNRSFLTLFIILAFAIAAHPSVKHQCGDRMGNKSHKICCDAQKPHPSYWHIHTVEMNFVICIQD